MCEFFHFLHNGHDNCVPAFYTVANETRGMPCHTTVES